MRLTPNTPVHRPRHISRAFHFGVAMGLIALIALLARPFFNPVDSKFLRLALSCVAIFSSLFGLILIGVAVSRSWGARRLLMTTLTGSLIITVGSTVAVLLDAIPAAKAAARLTSLIADTDLRGEEHPAVAEAEKVIVFNEQSLRYIDVCKHYDTWIERHLIEPFNRHYASGDSTRDEAARALILGTFRNNFEHPNVVSDKLLKHWSELAMGSNSGNPIVLLCYSETEYDPALAKQSLETAERMLAKRSDSKTALFLARLYLWSRLSSAKPDEDVSPDAVIEALASAIQESAKDEAEAWAWAEVLRWNYRSKLLRDHADRIVEAISPLTEKHPWLVHFVRGKSKLAQAEELPGLGLKKNSDPLFQQHNEAARDEFVKGWEMNPKHPGCASGMIIVSAAIGQAPERESREWFDRATTAVLDFPEAYRRYCLSLNGYWRGNYEATEAFLWSCAYSERSDTRLPLEFLRTWKALSSGSSESEHPFQDEDKWDTAKETVDSYLAEESTRDRWRYWASTGAIIAYRCRKFDECRNYLEQVGYEVDNAAAVAWGVDAESWSAQVAAELSPAATDVSNARTAEERGEYEQAINHYSSALDTPNISGAAKSHLATRLAQLKSMKDVQEREWAPLFESKTLDGWETAKGHATITPDATIEAKKELILVKKEPAGDVFEVRGEIELEGEGVYVPGGFAIGQPGIDRNDSLVIQLRIFQTGATGVFLRPNRYFFGGYWDRPSFGRKSPFHLRIIGNRCLLSVNGQTVLDRRIEEPAAMKNDSRLALVSIGTKDEAVVRWRSLEWRRP